MSDENSPPTHTPKQESAFNLFFDRIYQIAETLEAEHKAFKLLLERQVALRGTILTYHLVTEQLIIQEITRLKNLNAIRLPKRINRMGYAEKLQLLPRQIAYASIRKGLAELNEIRNLMAHDLNFVPELKDIPAIIACLQPYFVEDQRRKPKDLEGNLRIFVKLSIGIFAARSGKTRSEIDKFIQSFPKTRNLFSRLID